MARAELEQMRVVDQRRSRQKSGQCARVIVFARALKIVDLAIGELDRFQYQIAVQQNLYGEHVGAGAASDAGEFAAGVGQALWADAVDHPRQQKTSEDRRVGDRMGGALARVEQDVGQRQRSRRRSQAGAGQQRPDDPRVQHGQEGGPFEHVLLGAGEGRVEVLDHALKLNAELGDFQLTLGEAVANRGSEKRRDCRRATQHASEAFARQAPDDTTGQSGEGGCARLIAEQGEVAEDGGWTEDVESDAVGLAFDDAFTQDVEGIGACALGEDDFSGFEGDLLECGGESGAVDWQELGEGGYGGELGCGTSDGFSGSVWDRQHRKG
jgi:hypothetical protein